MLISRQMVCEGPCNPDLAAFDALAAQFAAFVHHHGNGSLLNCPTPEELAAARATLSHTTHVSTGRLCGQVPRRQFVCVVCGHVRT